MSDILKGKEFPEGFFDAVKDSPAVAEFIAGLQADLREEQTQEKAKASAILLNNDTVRGKSNLKLVMSGQHSILTNLHWEE